MSDPRDFNQGIIDEFRANQGVVGGYFDGMTILLLHHTGAKSGAGRVNPVAYRRDGDDYVIFASKGGAPTNPDWYWNLRAHPDVSIEVGTESFDVRATVLEGDERDRLWGLQKSDVPGFADYEAKTTRTIPVVRLSRVA